MVELYRVEGSLAFLSLVGSFLIILSAMFVKELRQHPTNLVLLLSICDFMFALKFAITSILPDSISFQYITAYCIAQPVWAQFWGIASISWNGIISWNLIANLRKPFLDTSKWGKYYHVFVWSLSGVSSILLVVLDMYGVSGDGTCWIKGDYNLFRLVFFIPLSTYFILGISAFIIGLSSTRSLSEESSVRTRMVFRMFFYTSVFIICWSGPMAHRFAQYWRVNSTPFIYADAIGQSIQGFANALVWLTNPSFFGSFKKNILIHVPGIRKYFKADEVQLPLLRELGVHDYLHDDRQDMQKLDIVIRKNIITFLLYGMKEACEHTVSRFEEPLSESDFKEVRDLVEIKHERAQTKEYRFVDFAPFVFQKLRAQAGITPEVYMASIQPDQFIKSLSNQKFSEGRSGSFFCFSPDKCFIIKTIPESEANLLNKILPAYYQYISHNPDSRLMRFYGLHSIRMHYGDQVFVIVMSNAFRTHRKIHERYDLKGSWVRREVGKDFRDSPGTTLGMDIDLRYMGRKVRLSNEQRTALVQQITDDATFLCSLGIMDYSVLLGIHFVDRAAEDERQRESSAVQNVEVIPKSKDMNRSQHQNGDDSDSSDERPLLLGSEPRSLEVAPSFEGQEFFPLSRYPSARLSASSSSPSTSDHSINFAAEEAPDINGMGERRADNHDQRRSPVARRLRRSAAMSSTEASPNRQKDKQLHEEDEEEREDDDTEELGSQYEDDLESSAFRDDPIVSMDGNEVYYLCIIDVLQAYDLNKKAERFWKVRIMHKDFFGVSVQPPPRYRDRFVGFAFELITSPDASAI